MTDHHDFHSMPAMSRRAFLAGLMAVPAAAAVPGIALAEATALDVEADAACRQAMNDLFAQMYSQEVWRTFQENRAAGGWDVEIEDPLL